MKKIVSVLLLFLLFANKAYALDICTPSDEYLDYMALTDKEKENYVEPFYCKELTEEDEDNSIISLLKNLTTTISASSMDSSYNAVDDGLITTPTNQGNLGTCWAFSSISAVEANARKNNVGSYNFSESHMIYSVLSAGYSDSEGKKGKYLTSNFDGGKITYAASYYFNNYGQLLDNEWPYRDVETKITSSQYKPGNKMISLSNFTLANLGSYSACTNNEISYIKNQIVKYGSVQASIYMNERLFKDSAKNYYISTTSNSSLPNHGISIVGWDDNVSKSKFSSSRDGAFIIKNSWGPTWSSDGYFYISYDDNFICKNTASFYGVSNKTFENTYASSDMVGVPTFTFSGTFYTSAKFNKKTSLSEDLKRVSFPVGESSKYYVYLVSDNNLYSTSNWRLLTSGTSSEFGIISVDLNNITLTSDFTIVVKYETSTNSSIFTMCTNVDDTSNMTISQNTNYYASSLSNWSDMSYIPIQSTSLSCEPNIYVYTNTINSTPTEQSIVINSISSIDDRFTVSITNNNVNTSSITYQINNSNNSNVTSHFNITPNYTTNKITITSDGTMSGIFSFIIKYNNKEARISFTLEEGFTSKDSSFIIISNGKLRVTISNNYTLTYEKLLSGLNIKNTSIQVINSSGNTVTSSSSVIGTNSKVRINSKTYTVIISGDVNCDGKISALDYIEVRKHIMGTSITDSGKLLASDLDNNNKISALDYIAIRKILMR